MKEERICIACPLGCHLTIDVDNNYEVTGNNCKKGIEYGKKELQNPTRTVTSTVRIKNGIYPRIPVKTNGEVPKDAIFDVMNLLDDITLEAPVTMGDIILSNIANTGIDLVVTRSMEKE